MFVQFKLTLVVLVLTVMSGVCDSLGFTHAAAIWKDDQVQWKEVALSARGFAAGIAIYWCTIRYFLALGVVAAELQTLIWFASILIGVACLSGRFPYWRTIDQLVAMLILLGISWLLVRVEH
jgi:hypothetical protein